MVFKKQPNGYPTKTLEKGTKVYAELVNNGYYLNHYVQKEGKEEWNRDRWECADLIDKKLLQDNIEFKMELLTPEQQEEVTAASKLATQKHSAFLAPKAHADEIKKAFDDALSHLFKFTKAEGGYEFEYDPRKNSMGNWYNTWVSMIGRRGKAGKLNGMEDIVKTFGDAVKNKLHIPDDSVPKGDTIGYKAQDIRQNIDGPQGTALRQAISGKGVTPTSYAASNVKELWAEVVEETAFARGLVSKELKDMLYQVISNTIPQPPKDRNPKAPIRPNPRATAKRPRRLVRRKDTGRAPKDHQQ